MDMLFALRSELRNLTYQRIGFAVSWCGYCPVPDLPPLSLMQVNLSPILRWFRELGRGCRIRVLLDDRFTGIELNLVSLLMFSRILFSYGDGSDLDVLLVEGVPEDSSGFWLRLKCLGFNRDIFWDARLLIARSDSKVSEILSVAEDSCDEDAWMVVADDTSSDTTNRMPPTSSGGGIRRPGEEKAAPPRMEIGGFDGGGQRIIRRERTPVNHGDSIEHDFLFCYALAHT